MINSEYIITGQLQILKMIEEHQEFIDSLSEGSIDQFNKDNESQIKQILEIYFRKYPRSDQEVVIKHNIPRPKQEYSRSHIIKKFIKTLKMIIRKLKK